MLDEHVLDVLLAAGKLGDGDLAAKRHDAGQRLRAIHHRSGLAPMVVAALAGGGGGVGEMSDQQAEACSRYGGIMRRLRVHATVLRRVCVEGVMPDRMDRLVRALDALACDFERSPAARGLIDEFLRNRAMGA